MFKGRGVFSKIMRRSVTKFTTVILLLGILALLLASFSACSSKPTASTTVYYQTGQAAVTSREILTVISATSTTRYARSGFGAFISIDVDAPPGTTFIIVEVTVTNVGRSSISISRNDFSLKDSEGREYFTVGYSGLGPYPDKKLATGQTASGKIAFVVPVIARGLELSCVLLGTPNVLGVWDLSS